MRDAQAANGAAQGFDALPEPSDARWVETAYGGALYLINLGLFLELYGDFSEPARPGIELAIWDFIALLGDALVGPAIRDDPLWPLLAELAGRSIDEPAGAGFAPPAQWRIPERWLAPFARSSKWRWSGRGGRLRVWHPSGFAVLDVPASERDYRKTLARELAPYRASGLCTAVTRRRTPPIPTPSRHAAPRKRALRRWLGWLMPYVRARLDAALCTENGVNAGRLVCACRARLRVAATHLDAHLLLADLPLEVRLAGLDRDPGWVPAAGRYIRFHFD